LSWVRHINFNALSTSDIDEQFSDFVDLAGKILPGYDISYFRPPYGAQNEDVVKKAAEHGLQTVIWSGESGGLDPETESRVMKITHPGWIVLSHSTRWYDVHDSSSIANGLIEKGYTLESLDTGLDSKDYWQGDQIDGTDFWGKK